MPEKMFAAFVMTYNRPEILPATIRTIFDQTLVPEKLLVVDNSDDDRTRLAVEGIHPNVVYHRMGYNAGPAGAAKTGLELLSKEGFKWIYWGDDDDPPPVKHCFEDLISLAESYKGKCGQVGMVGHRFNRFTSIFQRTKNEELFSSEFIKVDSIGGNQCKIINAQVVQDGVSPDAKLFFGFEELDFDLSMKKAGYDIIVHSQLFLGCRQRHQRMNVKRVIGREKKVHSLWRDYYSIRNFPYIMLKNRYYLAFIMSFVIALAKTGISFKYGLSYGASVSGYTLKALRDFLLSRFYKMS